MLWHIKDNLSQNDRIFAYLSEVRTPEGNNSSAIMKLLGVTLFAAFVIGAATAQERFKRQAAYESGQYDGGYAGSAGYRQPTQQQHAQQQHAQQQQSYGGHQQSQHYPAQPPPRRPNRQHSAAPDEEEKEEGPHPLQLLLEKSKFNCDGKSDGYYADSDVGCQAFHYCVSGQKHSMMCPEATVFHQVHLNCVPADQDICSKANKFFFVNDYLNKPLEQRGPNNTVVYAQRYYPDNYAVGDPFIPPHEGNNKAHREPPAATYGLGPAYKEQEPAQHHQSSYQTYPQQAPHRPAQQTAVHRPAQQTAVHRPAQQQHNAYVVRQQYSHQPAAQQQPQQQHRPRPQQQLSYGYGAEQSQQQHQLQAQRAYQQQQQYAQAPVRQRYAS